MGVEAKIPAPPIFRRKKYGRKRLTKTEKQDNLVFEAIPRFFEFRHPTTQWLINMVNTQNEKELMRILYDKQTKGLLQFEPDRAALRDKRTNVNGQKDFVITKTKYFQIMDRPDLFVNGECRIPSLFNRHAVMYLTPLGLAIYLKRPKVIRMFCECIDRDTNSKMILARQPQYITYMNDRFGDIYCMYDHNLGMYNEAYEELGIMMSNENWFPMEPFRLVYRKRYVETYLNFDDFLDYAFYSIFTGKSYLNLPNLCNLLVNSGSPHFKVNYLCQPSRANKKTLLRDAEKIINNCKSYPRRLLRCAYYADKELISTFSLIRAASMFINTGMFVLQGEPAIPFLESSNRKKRLENMIDYEERKRSIDVIWPAANYEFDADCCIALLLGLMAKCHRFGKWPCFRSGMLLASRLVADSGWINYFNIISDLEFKDYFMGLDDAEKVRFRPEVFGFVRECVKLQVMDSPAELGKFFSNEKLEKELRNAPSPMDNDFLASLVLCQDTNITRYVTVPEGERLKMASTIICGPRVRGMGRDDPANRYYADLLAPPKQTMVTTMINTSHTETEDDFSDSSTENTGTDTSTDSHEQRVIRKPSSPPLMPIESPVQPSIEPPSAPSPPPVAQQEVKTVSEPVVETTVKPKVKKVTKTNKGAKTAKKALVSTNNPRPMPARKAKVNDFRPVKPLRKTLLQEDATKKKATLGVTGKTVDLDNKMTDAVGKVLNKQPKVVKPTRSSLVNRRAAASQVRPSSLGLKKKISTLSKQP